MIMLQWNIQSIRTKFNELKILLSELNPCCVSLQETMLGDNQMNPPSGYVMLQSRRVRDDRHERSVAILVNNSVQHENILLNTQLQAAALRIGLGKWYTICTIYLPHIVLTRVDIEQLIGQLRPLSSYLVT